MFGSLQRVLGLLHPLDNRPLEPSWCLQFGQLLANASRVALVAAEVADYLTTLTSEPQLVVRPVTTAVLLGHESLPTECAVMLLGKAEIRQSLPAQADLL